MEAIETVSDFLKVQDMSMKIDCKQYEEVIIDLENVKAKLELLLTVIPTKSKEQPAIGVPFVITNMDEIREKVSHIERLSKENATIVAALKRIT